jgi:tripartite-type tricarboxylate transporter receptor subunit TctC
MSSFHTKMGLIVGTAVAVQCFVSIAVQAQQSPFQTRPITILSPYTGGGTTDFVLRTIQKKIEADNPLKILIESRPGGAGAVAANAAKAGAADGTTLLLADAGTFAANVSLFSKLSYNPLTDFKPITAIYYIQNVVAVSGDSPVNSLKDLVTLAKTKEGGLNYSSPAVGASGHLQGSLFAKISGAPMTHVAYRGALPAATDVIAGRIDFCFCGYSTVRGFVESKKMKLIAIAAKSRDPILPDVPTTVEQGFSDVLMDVWFGLVTPAGTPDGVVANLNAIFVPAITSPEVGAAFSEQAVHAMVNTPSQFRELIAREIERYRLIVAESGAIMK